MSKTFRIDLKAHDNKAMWEDSSNGWMCSKCFRDSTFDYYKCPHCGRTMVNGTVSNFVEEKR